ncbi:MAG: YitT family protein [Bacteroidales bacterium]|nr:YitT family protein [Bacteroidales bacterium]
MPTLKKNIWTIFKEWSLITLGIIIYTVGWSVFLVPNNLVGGGVTGISSIIQYATGGVIKIGYSYFVLNALLLVAAFFILGSSFGGKTIYAIVLASFGLTFFQGVIPHEIIDTLALQNGKLMSTLMGGIMAGIGIGMSISNGGSTGGTDIIAIIYTKYRNVSPGKVILFLDVIIICSSFFIPSVVTETAADGTVTTYLMPWAEKFTTVVYGLILVTVNSFVLDLYINGSQQSVQLFILSKKHEQIADAITQELHRGVTVLEGKGWYTKEQTEVLMVLTRKTDLNLLLRYIKAIDSEAFLSVSSVSGVYGKGFQQIKGSSKK